MQTAICKILQSHSWNQLFSRNFWKDRLKNVKFKAHQNNTRFFMIVQALDDPALRPAGVSWDLRPCLLLPAAPGCGNDGRHCLQSLPPPERRGCPRQAGSQWLSSRPCPGHRDSHLHFCDNDQRRPPSRLERSDRHKETEKRRKKKVTKFNTAVQTKINVLNGSGGEGIN